MDPELLTALSLLLDQPPRRVAAAWERVESGRGYTTIAAERLGKQRVLHVPDDLLADVQRSVLRSVLYRGPISPAAYGGVPGRSFVAAARKHLAVLAGPAGEGTTVLSLDVRDAFHSTTTRMVRGALRGRLRPELRVLGLGKAKGKELVSALTHLVTVPRAHRTRCLPLGAPTSMALFNLVFGAIDREVFGLLGGLPGGATYTRYVDDLVVSGPKLPPRLHERIGALLGKHDFRLNERKVRLETGAEATVYGLRWESGGLTLAAATTARCAARIRAAQEGLAHEQPSRRRRASEELRGMHTFLRPFYEERGLPRPAELTFEVPPRVAPAPAEHLDLLWS